MMRDIPILFSAPMVRALLEGRKTMTRRILKPQLVCTSHAAWPDNPEPVPSLDDNGVHCATCGAGMSLNYRRKNGVQGIPVRFSVGDRLWVREAAAFIDNSQFSQPSYWQYRADTNGRDLPGDWPADEKDSPERPRWRPSIHMPRAASRITDIVTGVNIERLQDISDADAIAEGIALAFTDDECRTTVGLTGTAPSDHGWTNYLWHGLVGSGITRAQADAWPHQFSTYKDPRGSFSSLWARINGPASWDANPFVVVTSFRVIKANIDAPEAGIAA